jgi:hypothetical protein
MVEETVWVKKKYVRPRLLLGWAVAQLIFKFIIKVICGLRAA